MYIGPWQELRLHQLISDQRAMLANLLLKNPGIDVKDLQAPSMLPSVVGGGQSYADSAYAPSEASSLQSGADSIGQRSINSDPGLRYGLQYRADNTGRENKREFQRASRFGLGRKHLRNKKKKRELKLNRALDQGRDYVRSQAKAAGRSAMPDVFSPSNPPQRRTDHDTHTHGHGYTPFVRQAPSAFSSVSSSSSSHAPGDPQEASFGKAVVKLPPWMSKFSGGGRPTRTHATQPSSSSSPLASQQSTRRGGGPLSSSTSSSTRAQDYNYRSFLSSGKNSNKRPKKKKKKKKAVRGAGNPDRDMRPNHEKVPRPAYVYPTRTQAHNTPAQALPRDLHAHTRALFDGLRTSETQEHALTHARNPEFNHHPYNLHRHALHKVEELKLPRAISPARLDAGEHWEEDAEDLVEWTNTLKTGMLPGLGDSFELGE